MGGINQAIRHSRRRGNPEPFPSANTVMAAPTRRVDGGRASTSFPNHVGRQPGLCIPASARMTGAGALDCYENAIFILMGGFNQAIRHSRRRGNPEPFLPSNLIESAGMVRVERRPVHQARHNCRNRLGAWPGLWIPGATGMMGRRPPSPGAMARREAGNPGDESRRNVPAHQDSCRAPVESSRICTRLVHYRVGCEDDSDW